MQEPSVIRRVEILEEKVEALERLPARMEALELQILQFREEVRAEFIATRRELRQEMAGQGTSLRAVLSAEIRAGDEETRREMHALHQDTLARIDALRTELQDETRGGDAETRRYMRVLHEEVISRIALIQESRGPRKRR